MENLSRKKISTKQLAQMGMMGALSVVLVALIHFPIFPSAAFLEYDPADIPLIIGAFLYGPVNGLILTAVVSVLQGLTVSAQSGWIGILMHLAATGGYVLLAGLIYQHHKTRNSAILAMVCGVVLTCITMVLWNLLLTPVFMGVPRNVVADMILPAILPFNIIKFAGNSFVAFMVYKLVSRIIAH